MAENTGISWAHHSWNPSTLTKVEQFVRRYVVIQDQAYLPVSLWVMATYLPRVFDCYPYLAIRSSIKRCGKTRLLEVLELLSRRAWRGTAVTSATLFRMMAAEPTLLLDEVENFKKARSESGLAVLAVLNAGHRKGATVPRCEGIGVAFYNVGGFKAFAAIGDLPDTLADRSILLEMRRKRADQETARFLFGMAKVEAAALAGSLEKWTAENEAAVKLSYETGADIEFLSDRDADLWRPLFAVCEVAAPDRLADLQWSARVLSAEKEGHEELLALQLLEVIRTIWPSNESNLATADLLARVKAHKAWAALDISPRLLSNWLRPFDVAPRQVRIGEKTVKGYRRSEFQEAWSHFLGIGGETKETTSADGGEAAISLEDAVA